MNKLLYVTLAILAASHGASAWETEQDSAKQVRNLLHDAANQGVGVLSTVFPATHPDEGLRGMVASGPEYFAPCYDNGDVLLLAMPVSQNWRNALYSDSHNVSLSIEQNSDPDVPDPRHIAPAVSRPHWDPARPSWRRGMPSKLRATLFGSIVALSKPSLSRSESGENSYHSLRTIQVEDAELRRLGRCFTSHHPDAAHWAPGSDENQSPHSALWARLEVHRVYAVGGFGDEHRIGWISHELYQSSGKAARLQDWKAVKQAASTSVDTVRLFGDSMSIDALSTESNGAEYVQGAAIRFT